MQAAVGREGGVQGRLVNRRMADQLSGHLIICYMQMPSAAQLCGVVIALVLLYKLLCFVVYELFTLLFIKCTYHEFIPKSSPILSSVSVGIFIFLYCLFGQISGGGDHCVVKPPGDGSPIPVLLSDGNCSTCYFYSCVMALELGKLDNRRSLPLIQYPFCFGTELWANVTGVCPSLSAFTSVCSEQYRSFLLILPSYLGAGEMRHRETRNV